MRPYGQFEVSDLRIHGAFSRLLSSFAYVNRASAVSLSGVDGTQHPFIPDPGYGNKFATAEVCSDEGSVDAATQRGIDHE
jgi:hypothetical protein